MSNVYKKLWIRIIEPNSNNKLVVRDSEELENNCGLQFRFWRGGRVGDASLCAFNTTKMLIDVES